MSITDVQTSLDEAIRLHEQGRWPEAERVYKALLDVGGDRYDVLIQFGLLRAQQGRHESAIALLRQAIGQKPDDAEGHCQLGAVLLARGRYEEALAASDQALLIDPEDPLAHYNRGAALQALDRPADAVDAYEMAIAVERQFPAAHYNLGTSLQALGHLEPALAAYAEAVVSKPDYAQAHRGVAAVQALLGRHDEAMVSFERALGFEPGDLICWLGLAKALKDLGRHDKAGVYLERAIAAVASLVREVGNDPNNVTMLLSLASAFEKHARYEEASLCLERAIAAKPDDPRGHVRLGDMMRARSRPADAIRPYERALLLKPDNVEILNNLGNALAALYRHGEAVTHFEHAIELAPDLATLHNNLATSLDALNCTEEAFAHYERALSLKPGLVDAELGMAVVLRELGRFDQSHQLFEKVINRHPTKIAAYLGLGVSKRVTADDPHLTALAAFADNRSSLSDEDQTYLHFALAKAYDDIGQHDRSFAHLLEGNRLKRQQLSYDEAKVLGFMDRCREFFTPKLFRQKAGHGDPSRIPVFIVGMMRSGSTLVEQILASHSEVFGAGERSYFENSLVRTLKSAGVRYTPAYLDAIGTLDDDWIATLAGHYLEALTTTAPTAQRITDKLLGNFVNIGLIHLALPNARIIHTCRDPLDTCLSCFSQLFASSLPFLYDLSELGRYYCAYERLMAHWRDVLPDGVMIDVQYEDVVDDLDGQARRIVEHCGLDWNEACLDFHRTERPVRTASVAQVRQPIYRSSVGRARNLEVQLSPLIEALGERPPRIPCA